jgi:hypothetical protein
MTDTQDGTAAAGAKPKIAILGEFSSGKSTLTNVLLGHVSSRVRVTATQAPPIWYSHGTGDPVVMDEAGTETAIAPEDVSSVPVAGTRYVRVFLPADILCDIDLIDMPGSSDPNMSSDIWQGVLPHLDAAIWCTPASQAWRQSEAAIWDEMDPDLQERSVLLVTRIDKVLSASDRARLMTRLKRETRGLFRDIVAVDLLTAQAEAEAGTRPDAGVSTGLQAVSSALETLRQATGLGVAAPDASAADTAAQEGRPATVLRLEDHHAGGPGAPPGPRSAGSVMPRRVTSAGFEAMRRPRRTSGGSGSSV